MSKGLGGRVRFLSGETGRSLMPTPGADIAGVRTVAASNGGLELLATLFATNREDASLGSQLAGGLGEVLGVTMLGHGHLLFQRA
jgi:hypothetical protein